MIWILQILTSTIFFANKALILIGKKTGWLVGAVAAAFACAYFFLIGLYIYTVLEIGLIVLMVYGFLKKDERNPRAEMAIRISTVVVMIALALFAWSGTMTMVELVSSLGLLIGTYLLTHGKLQKGWLLYIVAHSFAACLGYEKHQQFFADFQVASAIVSAVGLIQGEKK